MPITKSAQRALRRDRRRQKINTLFKNKLKKALKKAKKEPNSANVKQAISLLDQAAKKKIIHKNKAARLKSKLHQKAKQASTAKKKRKPQGKK